MPTHVSRKPYGFVPPNPPPKPSAGSWWLCPPEEFFARAESHKHRMADSLGAKMVDSVHIRRMEKCQDS